MSSSRIEQELQELRGVVEAIDDAIIAHSPSGVIDRWSPSAQHIFGYTAQEVIGKPFDIVVSGAVPPGAERIEAVWRHKNGRPVHIRATRCAVSDKADHTAGTTYIVRDITEKKASEEQLRIAAAIFSIHEAIVVTDAHARIIRVNQAFEDITGYSAAEALGQNPRMLKSGRHGEAFYESMWRQLLDSGSWVGEIWDRRKSGEVYPKWLSISVVRDAAENITHYVSSFTDISERKASDARVQHLAYHDALTGLANRFSLNERLAQTLAASKRGGKMLALMLLDLDHFKSINDTLGHPVGDQLLVQVAQRLVASVRQSDIVARLGGDEFVILLPDIESSTDAAHVAAKVVESISEPYFISNHELRTSPSIGVCLYPDDATEDQELIKKADLAMYHAKASGRGNYQFFNEEMQHAALQRIRIERDLRVALATGQFLLHYQPQLDLRTGRLVGVEALVRWQHPERGLISPLDFISIAEESGLIMQLGDWVIREACRQLAVWRRGGIDYIKMSVNLAASQFSDVNLPARIQEIMAINGLPADSLDLEVTESMMMKSPSDTVDMMKILTEQGLSLSIDDFGTGYSSLSYLKLFPISTLKIDRSFVEDMDQDDATICDITVLLAHKLGMRVVAEGVETEAQLKYLLSIGCEKIQGYLISKPLPANLAEEFMRNYVDMTHLGTIDIWCAQTE